MHSLPLRRSACCGDSFPWLGSLGSTVSFLVKVSGRDEDNILTLVRELFTADGALAKSKVFPFFSAKKSQPVNAVPLSKTHLSDIVIEEELVGVRSQTDRVGFLALGADPHLQEVRREHVALQQERVVFFQQVQRLA